MNGTSKEELFDAFVRAAIREEIEHTEQQTHPVEHEFSARFDKKMKRLLRTQRRQAWITEHKRKICQIAAAAACVVLVSGILLTRVEAVRIPVMRFFFNVTDKYTEVIPQRERSSVSNAMQRYMPQYIPDDFAATDIDEQKTEVCITYEKEDGACFILDFWVKAPDTSVDTENATVEEIQIQGSPAIVVQKQGGKTYVIWTVNGHQYSVEGYLTKEQALRILESVPVST